MVLVLYFVCWILLLAPTWGAATVATELEGGLLERSLIPEGASRPALPSPMSKAFDTGRWLFPSPGQEFFSSEPLTLPFKEVGAVPLKTHPGGPFGPVRSWSPWLELDFYRPKRQLLGSGSDALAPLIFHIHGGGWDIGDKSLTALPLRYMIDRGYAVSSLQYRFRGNGYTCQDIKADITDALEFLRDANNSFARAHELGFDPNRIIFVGESAGGHLATLMAYDLVDPARGAAGSEGQYSGIIRGVLNMYGIVDLEKFARDGIMPQGDLNAFVGCSLKDQSPECRELWCVSWSASMNTLETRILISPNRSFALFPPPA